MKNTLQTVLIGACALSIASTFVFAQDRTESTNGDPVSMVGIALWALIVIVILAGVFGGIISWFISSKGEDAGRVGWLKSVVVGTGASFLMPLFLNTISSTLVPNILDGKSTSGDVLVFAGFCLLAAISSRAFIETLTNKVLREVRETKEKQSDEMKSIRIIVEANRLTEEGFQEGRKGKTKIEIVKYKEALALDAKNSRARTNLAIAMGREEPKNIELQMQQIQKLSNVIEDDPGFENAYYNRAALKARVIFLATESGSSAPYGNEDVLADLAKSVELAPVSKLYAQTDEDFTPLKRDEKFKKEFERLVGTS